MKLFKPILLIATVVSCYTCCPDCYNIDDPEDYQYYETNTGIIGTQGGELLVTDPDSDLYGCGVFIDAGSLSQAVSIQLSVDRNTSIPDHPEAIVIEFNPTGTTFNSPIVISLSYAHISSVDGSDIGAVYYNSNANTITNLDNSSVLADDKIILAETDHFSGYAAIQSSDNSNTYTDSRDGKKYKTEVIGGRTWMAENLAYLPKISTWMDAAGIAPCYYVYDYEGTDLQEASSSYNYQTYGTLYNYYAAKAACPSGWHLPSDDEWKSLEKQLGMYSNEVDETGQRSSGDVGYKLKSTSGWANNGNGSNSSGFNALPGGYYDSFFKGIGTGALFLSSTKQRDEGSFVDLWYRSVGSSFNGVNRWMESDIFGMSVRCIR